MAMNKAILGKALADKILSSDASAEMKTQITSLWTDLAGVIIDHITQNATITVAAGIPVSTAGSATAQTGSTTGTGTATIA